MFSIHENMMSSGMPRSKNTGQGSFRDLLEEIHVSGEQEIAELYPILPGRSVAADTDLLPNDLASGFIDARNSPRFQRFYDRRFAGA